MKDFICIKDTVVLLDFHFAGMLLFRAGLCFFAPVLPMCHRRVSCVQPILDVHTTRGQKTARFIHSQIIDKCKVNIVTETYCISFPSFRHLSWTQAEGPVQPQFALFPRTAMGDRRRNFWALWYSHYTWIEYSQCKDGVYCYGCKYFGFSNSKSVFTSDRGHKKWKKAMFKDGGFASHTQSEARKLLRAAGLKHTGCVFCGRSYPYSWTLHYWDWSCTQKEENTQQKAWLACCHEPARWRCWARERQFSHRFILTRPYGWFRKINRCFLNQTVKWWGTMVHFVMN